jgi:hypothetical protein
MTTQIDQRVQASQPPKKQKLFKQGYYKPKNPEKYIGDVNKIVYRSSWELNAHTFFDNNTRVIRWGSEIICIPYLKPTDNKVHRYYPDYYVEYITDSGEIVKEVIELKPSNQTKQPRGNHKHKLYEQLTYAVNVAKWTYAKQWCDQHNVNWRVITEKSIFS